MVVDVDDVDDDDDEFLVVIMLTVVIVPRDDELKHLVSSYFNVVVLDDISDDMSLFASYVLRYFNCCLRNDDKLFNKK